MKRWILVFLALLMAWPLGGLGEESGLPDWFLEEWEEEELESFMAHFSLEGDTLIVHEGVTALGYYCGEWDDEKDEPADKELAAHFEDSWCFEYYFYPHFSYVQWPSTLRYLGDCAFSFYFFKQFTLPASLEVLGENAFYGCTFDTLRIEASVPYKDIAYSIWDHCTVGAYEAPEDHPLYKTVDGVLFTRDGKTLLSYPNGKQDAHYDVPAGVERIGDHAFREAEALKTVSLPIGLKAVEDGAFRGCTRLQSIALPLTVREMGEKVFDYCVSLELVSLPESMEAERTEGKWWVAYYPDDQLFRGDNGDTGHEALDSSFWKPNEGVRLVNHGEMIPLYEKEEDETPMGYLLDGMILEMIDFSDHRALVRNRMRYDSSIGWVDLAYMEYLPPEAFFSWDEIKVPREVSVWTGQIPAPGYEMYPENKVFSPTYDPDYCVFGPFVMFGEDMWKGTDAYACRIQDVELTRSRDGTDEEYGVLCGEKPFDWIPMLDGPGGEAFTELYGGAQVKILAEEGDGYRVTTGLDTGWVARNYVIIIPETQEGAE